MISNVTLVEFRGGGGDLVLPFHPRPFLSQVGLSSGGVPPGPSSMEKSSVPFSSACHWRGPMELTVSMPPAALGGSKVDSDTARISA